MSLDLNTGCMPVVLPVYVPTPQVGHVRTVHQLQPVITII